jgi:hypothetical protein
MKEVLSWFVRWARRAGTRHFCSALVAALEGPVQNTISVPLFPFAQQAGQAAVLGRLSLSVCLWIRTRTKICEQNFRTTKGKKFFVYIFLLCKLCFSELVIFHKVYSG